MKSMPVQARRFARCLPAACLLAASLATAAEPFDLYRTVFQIPERGAVTGYALVAPEWKIAFLAPPEWTVEVNRDKREVILTQSDLFTVMSFRLPSGEKAAAGARQRVRERFPGARVVREFACFANGRQGTAFDLEVPADKDVMLSVRLAFITLASGPVEFQLTSVPAKAAEAYFNFGCLMTSLHLTPLSGAESRSKGDSVQPVAAR